MNALPRFALPLLLLLAACPGPTEPDQNDDAGALAMDAGDGAVVDAGETPDAGPPDAGDKAAACASSFGNALTNSFGRVDGVVVAVVKPTDTQCTLPNDDHVVVQVELDAAVYRMVVNVRSAFGDPDVRFAQVHKPLVGPAWDEGWHPMSSLDYPTTLDLHSNPDGGIFTAHPMNELSDRIAEAITIGARISVFATSSGGTWAHSAHKIHRNGQGNNDGALVLEPEGPNPRWLVFHFANQSF